ncbi:MAG: sugar transporter substrate-binding protein [Frondihabitans sp.]|nr:sugar transporter substrate-binding protein [Frondihabitans sp.]
MLAPQWNDVMETIPWIQRVPAFIASPVVLPRTIHRKRDPVRQPAFFPSNTRHVIGAVAVAAALLLGVSACSTSAGASSTASSNSGASSAEVTTATAELAKYTALPTFTAPGPAIDISSLKGKTIYSVEQSSSNPFVAAADSSEAKIAKQYGIKFVDYSTQGTPAEWIRGINAAIDAKASAILLNALDPRLVAPQVAAAKAAGIPVISEQFFDLSQSSDVPTTLAGTRSDDFTEAAKLLADQAIKATNGKVDAIVIENSEQLSTLAMLKSMKAEFAANCSGCTVKYINVPSADWATKIQSQVQSSLVSDPNINYVIPIYDPMTQFVVPAITATSKTSSVHIATFNGTPAALTMLENGPTVTMDIGENLQWLAYANLDEAFRAMLGKPTVANEHTALRVFTSSNVADTGTPPAFNTGFGDSYMSGYAKLWGQG